MYYIAKFFQAAALTVILAGFLFRFPSLIDMRILALGGVLFVAGWALQSIGLKK